MLIDQLQNQDDFTESEKAIANYLLSRTEGIGMFSTMDLAQETCTSKATVTRLCRKVGISSFKEFQHTFDRELAAYLRINEKLNLEPINANTTYNDLLRILPMLYENAISSSALMFDKCMINRAVSRIHRAKKLDIYGSGVTYSIAQLAAFKFSTLGIDCGTYSGLNEHYIMADRHPEDKVIIIFSLTGGNVSMIRVAGWLKKRKYYVLGIGGKSDTGLMDLCSDYIALPMDQNVLGLEIMKAFNVINYTIDLLFSSLLVEDFDHNREVAARLYLETKELQEAKIKSETKKSKTKLNI